ncbi:hypothetical protein PCE1_001260 [Barthelona sp. PCE]
MKKTRSAIDILNSARLKRSNSDLKRSTSDLKRTLYKTPQKRDKRSSMTKEMFSPAVADKFVEQVNDMEYRVDSMLSNIQDKMSRIFDASSPRKEIAQSPEAKLLSNYDSMLSLSHLVARTLDTADEVSLTFDYATSPLEEIHYLLNHTRFSAPIRKENFSQLEIFENYENFHKEFPWYRGNTTKQHERELGKFVKKQRKQQAKDEEKKRIEHEMFLKKQKEDIVEKTRQVELMLMEQEDLRSQEQETLLKQRDVTVDVVEDRSKEEEEEEKALQELIRKAMIRQDKLAELRKQKEAEKLRQVERLRVERENRRVEREREEEVKRKELEEQRLEEEKLKREAEAQEEAKRYEAEQERIRVDEQRRNKQRQDGDRMTNDLNSMIEEKIELELNSGLLEREIEKRVNEAKKKMERALQEEITRLEAEKQKEKEIAEERIQQQLEKERDEREQDERIKDARQRLGKLQQKKIKVAELLVKKQESIRKVKTKLQPMLSNFKVVKAQEEQADEEHKPELTHERKRQALKIQKLKKLLDSHKSKQKKLNSLETVVIMRIETLENTLKLAETEDLDTLVFDKDDVQEVPEEHDNEEEEADIIETIRQDKRIDVLEKAHEMTVIEVEEPSEAFDSTVDFSTAFESFTEVSATELEEMRARRKREREKRRTTKRRRRRRLDAGEDSLLQDV